MLAPHYFSSALSVAEVYVLIFFRFLIIRIFIGPTQGMSSTDYDDDSDVPLSDQLEPSLVRRLLTRRHPDQRFHNDAVLAATELIRRFILEARERAAVEAECEADIVGGAEEAGTITSIKKDHILRVASEMLLDFT